jgi:DNA modification methylase
VSLARRLIECFCATDDRTVLDPFAGVGTTAIAAEAEGKVGVGIELSEEFAEKGRRRPRLLTDKAGGERRIYTADAADLTKYVEPGSVDLVITSPPYWDILLQRRTADYKEIRHYGSAERDLGKIGRYQAFLYALQRIFKLVYESMRPGKYCCVVVMDLRKKDKFYPFHSDLGNHLAQLGFELDDIIIWDRRREYNNMRPLGYPSVFRINKAHEYIMVFRKPRETGARLP